VVDPRPLVRVLGIDPGSRFLGFGVVEARAHLVSHLGSGVLRLDGDAPLGDRLQQIFVELGAVLRSYRPGAVAVEGVFTHKNPRSALILGHARGVALLLAAQAGLPVYEYAPARVKRSVGAGGNDSKDSVARMVTVLLKLQAPLARADAYDALAVALCHCGQVKAGLGVAAARAPAGRRGPASDFAARLRPSVVPPVRVAR
jgi:crossover junction endodeoxyribonuclease RuvC